MNFIRIIKSDWGRKLLPNGKPNPNFKEAIQGLDVLEGTKFTPDFLKEKNNSGYNIYYFPNRPSKNVYTKEIIHLNGKMIDDFRYVFVDMDLKDGNYKSKAEFITKIGEFPLKPTRIVDSGHGIHVYWEVSNLDRKYYICLQLQLLNFFKTDPSVWTVLQLMRLPGYKNTKDFDASVECFTIEENKVSYTAQELTKQFPKLTEDQKAKARLHVDRLDGKVITDVSNWEGDTEDLPDRFLELLAKSSRVAELFNNPGKAVGGRSVSDMKLAHILHTEKFNYREVCHIIANTQKSMSKGASKLQYVLLTVDNVFHRRKNPTIQTVSEFLNAKDDKILEPQVHGPYYMDEGVLGSPWRRKELLGIISGPGVGKTALALNVIRDILENKANAQEIAVIFSLEMTRAQIAQRWVDLVGKSSPMGDRLYIIDTALPNGDERQLGLQEIHDICKEIEQTTARKINTVVVDHFHILSTRIDIRKKPAFSIDAEQGTGFGDIRNMSKERMCGELRTLVKLLNVFGIILTQTSKARGKGWLPIQKDGCYGVSQYENIMDRIITVFQPLYLIQKEVNVQVTAFMYVKIREKHRSDKIWEQDPKVLTYSMVSGAFSAMTPAEYQAFLDYLPIAKEARKTLESGEVSEFTTT